MSERSGSAALLAATLVLVAIAATPVLAKEGAEARLDTAISRSAEPGSTLEVGWSVFTVTPTGVERLYGSPIYIKLVASDGSYNDAAGTEALAGSGHYTASIVVPQGGIDQVVVGLAGYVCYENGDCERSDVIFPLTDDPLVSGDVPGTVVGASSGEPTGLALVPHIVVGVASALAAGSSALILARRRQVGVETASGASGD